MDEKRDRIRERAFALWEDEGRPESRDWDHWLQAEAEIASEMAPPTKKRATSRKKKAAGGAPKAKGRKQK